MPSIIRCESLFVAYGQETVLHDVTFEVERGSFLPFVGPNGSGKTTLLQTILGLLRPLKGRVITPFDEKPPGYVPQQKAIDPLYPVTARQIVQMGIYPQLGWWRRPNGEQRGLIDQALERFGLASDQDKTFSQLSGGMKQKIMVARAFVSGADVFVMDEPTLELDEESAREVLEHLSRLSREEGKTILVAQHGLDRIASRAETVCLLDHGRLTVKPAAELSGK